MLFRQLNSEMSFLVLNVLVLIIAQCVGQPTTNYAVDDMNRLDCFPMEVQVQILSKQIEILQKNYRDTAAKINGVVDQLGQCERKLENAVTKVLNSSQKTLRNAGAFSANTIAPKIGPSARIQRGEAIIYHRTSINDGGHYDTMTGHYTCPLTGLYFFTFSLYATGSTITHGVLKKGDELGADVLYDGGKRLSLSSADILKCAAGETVYVHSHHGAHLENWPGLNKFSGFLISENSTGQ